MFGANPTHHRVAFIIFSSMVVAASCYGYAFHQEELASFTYKNKLNRAKHMQNERGKPGSVCYPTDTVRQIHLSVGQ